VDFETLSVREEGAVLFAEIAAPPMNLLGPELVRDLVSLPSFGHMLSRPRKAKVLLRMEGEAFGSGDCQRARDQHRLRRRSRVVEQRLVSPRLLRLAGPRTPRR
jgi:hypothetical protein